MPPNRSFSEDDAGLSGMAARIGYQSEPAFSARSSVLTLQNY